LPWSLSDSNWHIQDLIVIENGKPKLLSDKFPIDQVFVIH